MLKNTVVKIERNVGIRNFCWVQISIVFFGITFKGWTVITHVVSEKMKFCIQFLYVHVEEVDIMNETLVTNLIIKDMNNLIFGIVLYVIIRNITIKNVIIRVFVLIQKIQNLFFYFLNIFFGYPFNIKI